MLAALAQVWVLLTFQILPTICKNKEVGWVEAPSVAILQTQASAMLKETIGSSRSVQSTPTVSLDNVLQHHLPPKNLLLSVDAED